MDNVTVIPEDLLTNFAVFKLCELGTDTILFIGFTKYSDLLDLKELNANPLFERKKAYSLTVIYHCRDRMEALNKKAEILSTMPMPILNKTANINRYTMVKCVQTGQVFKNAKAAGTYFGFNPCLLSMHLNGKPGYRSIRGKTFIRVGYYGTDEAINPQEVIF